MRRPSSFTTLWASQASSNTADGVLAAAAPLLVATLTRDPLAVAAMTIAQFLPRLILILPAGVLTDRWDRQRILFGGNLLRCVAFALLAAAIALHWQSIWLLYVIVFVAGSAETLVDNAALTIPPRIVPRERLERANGTLFATQSVVNSFIGPPVGSGLMAFSASLALLTSSSLYAIAALVALMLPQLLPRTQSSGYAAPPSGAARPRESFVAEITAGWREFWSNRLLRRVAVISAAFNLCATATDAILVLLATGPLHIPHALYGLFIAAPALGALVGSLVADRAIRQIGGGPLMWAAGLLPALSYIALGLSESILVAVIVMFSAAIPTACNQITVSTLRQAAVPDALLGRVTAAYRLVVLGIVPFGALAGGILGSLFGVQTAFVISGSMLLIATVALIPGVTTRALRQAESTVSARDQ
ncbi:MAG: MFS transporter [Microbacterium sp.]